MLMNGVKSLKDYVLKNTYITGVIINEEGHVQIGFIDPFKQDGKTDPCIVFPATIDLIKRLCSLFGVSRMMDIVRKPCRVICLEDGWKRHSKHHRFGFFGFADLMKDDNIAVFQWWQDPEDLSLGVAEKWKPRGDKNDEAPSGDGPFFMSTLEMPPFMPWKVTDQMDLLGSNGKIVAKSVDPMLADWLTECAKIASADKDE